MSGSGVHDDAALLVDVARRIAAVSPGWAAALAPVEPRPHPQADAPLAPLGPDRAAAVETIREGWLLHRGQPRVARDADPDLALLIGDWCYAAGLSEIAEHGSLDDVATLARLVAALSARGTEPVGELEPLWHAAIEELAGG